MYEEYDASKTRRDELKKEITAQVVPYIRVAIGGKKPKQNNGHNAQAQGQLCHLDVLSAIHRCKWESNCISNNNE